ncbi:5' nucleotidase, NT5C type [Oscillibacter sp.]|uniref:5' nucleotidase, NT5C type n=1 Tax=Oscillibacter sp. TaxID=1945593 RepID=UPI002897A046|nr:hypothetical protein [Oscillibacter sp.]
MEQNLRLFVDMDGTLAEFQKVSAMEELYERGYFAQLPPQQGVVDAVRLLIYTNTSVEVFILSSVLFDSRFAMEEKNGWLNKYLPEVDRAHRIFLPCGESKVGYVPGTLRESDCLLDDYTKNLEDWSRAGGRGIKLLNGINHTQRSWSGARISIDRSPAQLAGALLKVADGHCVLDERPSFAISAAARELQRAAVNTGLQYEPDL